MENLQANLANVGIDRTVVDLILVTIVLCIVLKVGEGYVGEDGQRY